MRKYEKNQIMAVIYALINANERICMKLKNKQYDNLYVVLEECQGAAIEIGEYLEKMQDAIEDVVRLLENYCELIYKTAVFLNKKEYVGARVCLTKVQDTLNCIVDEMLKIKAEKVKVLFLPYKKEMWTSMESIYDAFCMDDNFDTKVMPIPYYDIGDYKNRVYCYEGERFNQDVHFAYYEEYCLEKEHPEVIFIHNPYDQTNSLTQVDEKYYAVNLKGNTECLVYSPYFTYGTYTPGYSEFLYVNPATLIADKIVVQSEKVKKIFCDLDIEEEKLMVLGTPKTDAVINKIKQVEIPAEWKEKIQNKKVFLLNTHLSYFGVTYENREKNGNVGIKMHNEIFDAIVDKEDVALIWRPHPLMFAMLRDRFPECLEYANELLRRIKNSKNCVVDMQTDYMPAFSCSDAMISTWSSLINEYMITGKPVMIFQRQMEEKVRNISPIDRGLNYFRFGKNRISFNKYIEMVKKGEDPIKNERMEMINKAFLNLDGTVGEKIYEQIRKEFEE